MFVMTVPKPTLAAKGTHTVRRAFDLLGGSADLISLGIVAARGSAAARRVLEGVRLDDIDRSALNELATVIRSSAQTVEFFGTAGQSGVQPAEAFASRLDVTLDAVLGDDGSKVDPGDLAAQLQSLAVTIESFAESEQPEVAEVLLKVFDSLANAVRRDTSAVGESTTVLS